MKSDRENMAKNSSKYSPLEKKAAQLWRGFRRNEEEAFWQAYDGLTQQAKTRQTPVIQTTQQRQPTAPLPQKQTSNLSVLWVFRHVVNLLSLLFVLGFIGYLFFEVIEGDPLPKSWNGYTSDTTAKEAYAMYDTKELLELKSKVIAFEQAEKKLKGLLQQKTDKKDHQKIFQPVLEDVRQKLDAHQKALKIAYAPWLEKKMHIEQIKDSLFKDYGDQNRPTLDTLYAYCQAQGMTINKSTIEYYLKYGGGINFQKNSGNLLIERQIVYSLFARQDTSIYFYADTNHVLRRAKKLEDGYYTLLPDKLAKVDVTQHHIYKARLAPYYQDYPVQVKPLGIYYETDKAQYYIPKNRHQHIYIFLLIVLHRKAH